MNNLYRNIIFVGFTEEEREKIKLKDTREQKESWQYMASHLRRFPYILYLDNLEEAKKHQGFIIFIKNKTCLENKSAKYYNYLNKKYYHVILCENEVKSDSDIESIAINRLYDDKIIRDVNSWYYSYLKEERKKVELNEKIKVNPRKSDIAIKLKIYIDKKVSFTAKEISEYFNKPLRTAQRYINYMNEIFENVEYDAKTKTWHRK